jgi:methylenetetrahydrofolate dehydrogenase (NADP+)/methenyltetrahydrofolate cyclohydrolase
MLLLDGKVVSHHRRKLVQQQAQQFYVQQGRKPRLVVILVGDDPASHVYVRNKVKACEDAGINSTKIQLQAGITQKELESEIQKLNQASDVDGILVQMPLPKHLSAERVFEITDHLKDVDGFGYLNQGLLMAGRAPVAPCTPMGIINLLEHYKISVAGLHCVVVGRSQIVGKPMALLLLQKNATVTIAHSKTKDLRSFTRQADLVVAAAGQKNLLGKDDFRKGAIVVDVGIHGSGSGGQKICGDVRFDEISGWVHAASPVPGGVGPMTITTLLENTLTLANLRKSLVVG